MASFSKMMSENRTREKKKTAGKPVDCADYCSADPSDLGTNGGRKFGKLIGTGETPEERLKSPAAPKKR